VVVVSAGREGGPFAADEEKKWGLQGGIGEKENGSWGKRISKPFHVRTGQSKRGHGGVPPGLVTPNARQKKGGFGSGHTKKKTFVHGGMKKVSRLMGVKNQGLVPPTARC